MNLFLDSASSKICILLFDEQHLDIKLVKIVNVNYLHAENLVNTLFDFFADHNFSVHQLEKIYFTNGPGKYIGTKVALIVIKMICIFVKNIQLYVANSLLFATGFFKLSSSATLSVSKSSNFLIEKNKRIRICSSKETNSNHNYAFVNLILQKFEKYTQYFQKTDIGKLSTSFSF